MKSITISMGDHLYEFCRTVGCSAGDIAPEKAMADALFKLAGELSLNALHKRKNGC